jgi:hypothetical protein
VIETIKAIYNKTQKHIKLIEMIISISKHFQKVKILNSIKEIAEARLR